MKIGNLKSERQMPKHLSLGCSDKGSSLTFKNRFFLAPMLEYNDIAFRLLCKKAGVGLVYTGMVNPLNPKAIALDDKPGIQLFSTSSKGIPAFIKKYDSKASLWDFNLGCPSKIAKKLGFGVFLHNNIETIESILKIIKNSTKKPITIKIRKSSETERIIKIAEKYCSAICIHPRTAEQGYSGEPDIEYAEKIKSRVKIPVIYSGNVNEKNAKELLKKFDFVMIGREAIGDPNIFSRLQGKSNIIKYPFQEYLKLAEKYKLKYSQIKIQALAFTRKKENAKKIRLEIVKAKTLDDIKKIMKGL